MNRRSACALGQAAGGLLASALMALVVAGTIAPAAATPAAIGSGISIGCFHSEDPHTTCKLVCLMPRGASTCYCIWVSPPKDQPDCRVLQSIGMDDPPTCIVGGHR